MLQAADAQRARARGNAELTGVDRCRVEVESRKALVERADAAQENTKIAGGGAWARCWVGARLLAGVADGERVMGACVKDRRVGGRRKALR